MGVQGDALKESGTIVRHGEMLCFWGTPIEGEDTKDSLPFLPQGLANSVLTGCLVRHHGQCHQHS